MPKDDLIQIEGQITDIRGGGTYVVALNNGVSITARLCGKMKKFKIRIVVGDRVTVAVSPYDSTHGLIMFRHKANQMSQAKL